MSNKKSDGDHKDTYAVVGELVMTSTAIDWQLNQAIIEVLDLGEALMLEPVVATLDSRLKIEILKEHARHVHDKNWQKLIINYCDKAEKVFKYRNIVCHTPALLNEEKWTFKPIAAAKLLKKINGNKKDSNHVSIAELVSAIKLGGEALGTGENLLDNFRRVNAKKRQRTIT